MSARPRTMAAAAANRSVDIGFITLSNEPLNTGPLELPAELVFIPSIEDEVIRPIEIVRREPADFVFEDEEADDEFEQSLSGLRIEDEEPSQVVIREDVSAVAADEPSALESVPTEPPAVAVAEIAVPTLAISESVADAAGPERLAAVSSKTPEMPRRNGVVQFLVSLLSVIAAFAAGIVATMWWFGFPPLVPNTVDLPVVAAEQPKISPPLGMVLIPGGEFQMGSDDGDVYSRPAHSVSVKPFYIDATEVTNEEYFEFIRATDHAATKKKKNGQFQNQ